MSNNMISPARLMADSVAAKAGQMAALIGLMCEQVEELGNGSQPSKDDLADLLYLAEEVAISVRRRANELADLMAKQSPGG